MEDWKQMLSDIFSSGLTQTEVGRIVGIKQPSVSALATGKVLRPSYDVADRLRALHRKQMRAPKKAAHAAVDPDEDRRVEQTLLVYPDRRRREF